MIRRSKIVLILTSIALSSCHTSLSELLENDSKNRVQTTNSISISLDNTRTLLGDKNGNSYPMYWSEGDRISINGVESEDAIIDKSNPAYATFNFGEELTNEYLIVYPATAEGKVSFAENQIHAGNKTFGCGVSTMYGVTTAGKEIKLNHLTGILKIGIVGTATLKKARISTINQPIAGLFDINFESGKVTPSSEAKYTINYSFGDGVKLDTSAPNYIHVAIPAGEYESISLMLYDSNGGTMTTSINAPSSKPIVAGNIREFKSNIVYAADNNKVQVGYTLPAWSEGKLDIHFINSGRGECCFYIMPDGTTLLIDAGETTTSHTAGKESVEQRPSASVRPYITYVNYIKHFLPYGRNYIDYCAPSHFHIDHVGQVKCATEVSPEGFPLTGLLAIYNEIPFLRILDHTYPDYEIVDDSDEENTEEDTTEGGVVLTNESATRTLDLSQPISYYWGKFVKWGEENNKFTAARFTPGENQIEMLYAPEKYPYFEIFNICANGFVWGAENGVSKLRGGEQDGNAGSCGIHMKYNDFDYIACGDLVSRAQNLVALYVRDFLNRGANQYHNFFDVFKAHHHLAGNSWGTQMTNANNHFTPKVVIDHCFNAHKPHPDILPLIVDQEWSEGFFATNIHPNITAAYPDLVAKIAGYDGHIVIRVSSNGEFYIYMLDDSNFEYRIKSIHGPYEAY